MQTYVCHLTFNPWPLATATYIYLAKETLLLLSMQCYYVCFADVSLWSTDSIVKDQRFRSNGGRFTQNLG